MVKKIRIGQSAAKPPSGGRFTDYNGNLIFSLLYLIFFCIFAKKQRNYDFE
jgi:hypothetical protein|nr:MAG TPA: hypothetical protein [Caudoviricetes sp.]